MYILRTLVHIVNLIPLLRHDDANLNLTIKPRLVNKTIKTKLIDSFPCLSKFGQHITYGFVCKHFQCQLCEDNSIHSGLMNGCSWKDVELYGTENVSTKEGLEDPTFGFLLTALSVEPAGPNIFHPMFWNTVFGSMNTFVPKGNIDCVWTAAFILD